MVRKSVDQTGANYTAGAVITFDQEVYDITGWHSTVTDSSRLNVPVGVTKVIVGASVVIANMTADTWGALILNRDGTNAFDGAAATRQEVGSTAPNISFASGPIPVTGGTSYFEVVLSVESDNSIDITAARTNFWAYAVA